MLVRKTSRRMEELVTSLKVRCDVHQMVHALEEHDKKGDKLFRHAMSNTLGPFRGYTLPVREVVGQVASNTLKQLELLLRDDKVGRIVIHGVRGVGKTFLMKHLYNSALREVERFDHVFWVTFPDHFTVEHVQDAIAAAVKCDLTSDDDLNARARKLLDKLIGFVSFALFLDGVPDIAFSLDQLGIPAPAEGRKCKLVLTTTGSTLEWGVLDRLEPVKVNPLPQEEAYQLFMVEASIGSGSVSYIDGIAKSLANRCCGVPRMIVNIATRLYGIDDPCEWRQTLFELECLGQTSI